MRYPLIVALLAILSALGLACDPSSTATLNPIPRATTMPTLGEELLGSFQICPKRERVSRSMTMPASQPLDQRVSC